MPREVFNIDVFDKGIISSIDSEDIPDNSASHSLDVDGDVELGYLAGRPTDTAYDVNWNRGTTEGGLIINDDGTRDYVGHDTKNNTLVLSKDIFGANTKSTLVSGVKDGYQQYISNNHELHVGMGMSKDTKPKWIGKVTSKTFGQNPSDDIVVEDAELYPGFALPFFYKILADATYLYGAEFSGTYIYKINRSTKDITTSTAGQFKRIQGICDDNADPTKMWVYDAGASSGGTFFKISKTDFSTVSSFSLLIAPSLSDLYGATVSDIECTSTRLWMGAHYNIEHDTTGAYIFYVPTASSNGVAPINATPLFETGHGSGAGKWNGRMPKIQSVPFRNLVKISSTTIGFSCMLNQGNYGGIGLTSYELSGGTLVYPRHTALVVTESSTPAAAGPIIRLDNGSSSFYLLDGSGIYSGLFYDSANLWMCIGNYLQKGALTIPTLAGEAPIPTWITSGGLGYAKVLNTPSDPNLLSTTVLLNRINGSPGVDSITTDLVTYSEIVDGGSFSISLATSGVSSVFSENTIYYYKLALEYDDYQVSPLSVTATSITNGGGVTTGVTVSIIAKSLSLTSKRLTGIQIYRSSSPTSMNSPSGFYRLIKDIPLDDPTWVIDTAANNAKLTFDDNVENTGASYEANVGISETLPSSIVYYGLGTKLNNELFVARCYQPYLPDASHMLFKSKPGRFDMFNWSTDFIRIPTVPVAIAAYLGRIYAFDENTIYRINPDSLIIEDIYEGVGTFSQRSVLVTDQGMFFCDKNNIYFHDGKQPIPIGSAILRSSPSSGSVGWRDVTHANHEPVIGYLAKKGYLVIAVSNLPDLFFCFNIFNKRWDLWSVPAGGTNVSFIFSPTGELYWSASDVLWNLAVNNSTRMPITWYSQEMTMGDPSQIKKFYEVIAVALGASNPTVAFALDGTESYNAVVNSDISPVGTRSKSIKFKILLGAGSTKIRFFSVIYRRMIGKR